MFYYSQQYFVAFCPFERRAKFITNLKDESKRAIITEMDGKPRNSQRINKLNDLSSSEWLKFQKSWFLHNPPPRNKKVLTHPAKFPETLIQEFIEFFTKKGMNILDPMAGTGSTLIACIRSGRNGYGIELNKKYVEVARDLIAQETLQMNMFQRVKIELFNYDANNIKELNIPPIDYCITSPPYWDMLKMKGAKTQKNRKESGLDVFYSDDPRDLGNISDYNLFIESLVHIYRLVYDLLRDKAYMTIIVKNVKKRGRIYPLAWDLGQGLSKFFTLKDERIWCQDNQRLAPYGLLNAWVSNTFHHYCLNFRKEL